MSRDLFDQLVALLSRPFDDGVQSDGQLLALFIGSLDGSSVTESTWRCLIESIHSVPEAVRRPWLDSCAMDLFSFLIHKAITTSPCPLELLLLLSELVAASVPREAVAFVTEGLSIACQSEADTVPLILTSLLPLLLKALLSIPNPKQRVKNALASLPSVARAATHLSNLETSNQSEAAALSFCQPFVHMISELRAKMFSEINDIRQLCLLALHIASCFFWSIDDNVLRRSEMTLSILGILKDGYQLELTGSLEHWLMIKKEIKKVEEGDEESCLVPNDHIRAGIALLALVFSKPNAKVAEYCMSRIEVLSFGLSLGRSLINESSLRQSHTLIRKAMDLFAMAGSVASRQRCDEEEDSLIEEDALEVSKVLAINVVFCSMDPALGKKAHSSLLSLLSGLSPGQHLRILHSLSGWPRETVPPPPPVVSMALSLLQHQIMKALTATTSPSADTFASLAVLSPISPIISSFVSQASLCDGIEGEVVLAALNLLRSICLYFNAHPVDQRVGYLSDMARKLLDKAAAFISLSETPEGDEPDAKSELLLLRLKLAIEL
jgi:hypothetical protein